jgi:hypothetical protein
MMTIAIVRPKCALERDEPGTRIRKRRLAPKLPERKTTLAGASVFVRRANWQANWIAM